MRTIASSVGKNELSSAAGLVAIGTNSPNTTSTTATNAAADQFCRAVGTSSETQIGVSASARMSSAQAGRAGRCPGKRGACRQRRKEQAHPRQNRPNAAFASTHGRGDAPAIAKSRLRAGEAMAHDRRRLAEIDKTAADVL